MIIAVKKDDEIAVAISICDCSINMSEKDLALADNLPFWKVKGEKDCYVGTDDLSYSTDLLRFNDSVFKGIHDGKSVIENVLPKMKDLLAKNNQLINNREWQGELIIIKSGKIFKISNYFCVSEEDECVVLGDENVLLGALDYMTDVQPKDSILTAIRHNGRMKNRKFFPTTIFDYQTKKKKVYYQ